MNKKTNILYVFHVSEIGGGSFCLLNMIKELDRGSFNPIVLLKNRGPLSVEIEKLGVTVHFEKSITTALYNKSIFKYSSVKQLWGAITSLSRVKYWIEYTNAEIVHLNTMMMYPYLFPINQLNRKAIIHMREHWPSKEHQVQLKFAKRIIKKYADKIIAINHTSANILSCPEKTEVIYDFIDFKNRETEFSFNELFGKNFKSLKVFTFLGGTIWIKGALEVIGTFYKEIKDANVRLLVIGCPNKDIEFKGFVGFVKRILSHFHVYSYVDKVKIIAQKDDRIIFLPPMYQIKSMLEQSFCLISFHTIPHANLALAESIYLGTPAIAASTPEALEYSNNGESALLFEMNNKEDFRQKLLFALKNEELIKYNTRSGMSRIRTLFDKEQNSLLLNNLYRNLLIK